VYRLRAAKESALVQASVGVYLVAVATGYALDGPALTIAYTIEAALIPLMTLILLKRYKLASKLSLFLIGPAVLALKHVDSSAWYDGTRHHIWHGDFAALAVLTVVFALCGFAFKRYAKEPSLNLPLPSKALLAAALTVIVFIIGLSMREPKLALAYAALIVAVVTAYRRWMPESTDGNHLYWLLSRHSAQHTSDTKAQRVNSRMLWSIAVFFGAAWIWRATHAVFSTDDIATMAALTIYTVIGLVAYVSGHKRDDATLVKAGALALGAVTARLMIIDIWDMALAQRIGTFLLVGTLFISTAFIGRKKRA